MGWFKYFVTELKLETGSNDVKDGGNMFFYDILELSDNNKKIIKTLINYLDLKKEYEDIIKKGQQVAILCKKDSEEKVIVEKLKPYNKWLEYVRKQGVKV